MSRDFRIRNYPSKALRRPYRAKDWRKQKYRADGYVSHSVSHWSGKPSVGRRGIAPYGMNAKIPSPLAESGDWLCYDTCLRNWLIRAIGDRQEFLTEEIGALGPCGTTGTLSKMERADARGGEFAWHRKAIGLGTQPSQPKTILEGSIHAV